MRRRTSVIGVPPQRKVRNRRRELHTYLMRTQPRTVNRGRIPVIERELARMVASGVPGDVVEFGCYRGGMTAVLRMALDGLGAGEREVHAYDAFAGIPAPGPHDGDHLQTGDFRAPAEEIRQLHDDWGLRRPRVHAGWFHETLPTALPGQVGFAYLDADRYTSVLTCLLWCVPRLAPGGVIVLDDYAATAARNAPAQPRVPGVMKACEDYFGLPLPIETTGSAEWGMGVFRAA